MRIHVCMYAPRDDRVAQACRNAAVQSEVRYTGQLWLQQVLLYNVQHTLQLAKDQHTVLSHHSLCATVRGSGRAQTTVQQ